MHVPKQGFNDRWELGIQCIRLKYRHVCTKCVCGQLGIGLPHLIKVPRMSSARVTLAAVGILFTQHSFARLTLFPFMCEET